MFHLPWCKINSSQYFKALLSTMPGEVKAFSACKAMLNCYLTTGNFRFYKHSTGLICNFVHCC